MRTRIKFIKTGELKYIGHLDLLRLVMRMNKITNLPIEYSQGFNPHQNIGFALPLSLGVESYGEYLDMRISDSFFIDPTLTEQWMERFNFRAPAGLKLLKMQICTDKTPSSMSLAYASSYAIEQIDPVITTAMIAEFNSKPSIVIKKTTKSGKINDLDIKPGVLALSIDENQIIHMTLVTNSEFNIKVEQVINVLLEPLKSEFLPHFYKQTRLDIYTKKDNKLVSLGEYNE